MKLCDILGHEFMGEVGSNGSAVNVNIGRSRCRPSTISLRLVFFCTAIYGRCVITPTPTLGW